MNILKSLRLSREDLSNKAFYAGVLATLTAGVPVCYAAGVEDLSGAFGVTMTWLLMGSATFFAMKRVGAFK